MLSRRTKVQKAGLAAIQGQPRPTVAQHVDSFACTAKIGIGNHFVLIDDIVTQGTTLLAAASVLKAIFPSALVTAFAVTRTLSDANEFEQMLAPIRGTITERSDHGIRNP